MISLYFLIGNFLSAIALATVLKKICVKLYKAFIPFCGKYNIAINVWDKKNAIIHLVFSCLLFVSSIIISQIGYENVNIIFFIIYLIINVIFYVLNVKLMIKLSKKLNCSVFLGVISGFCNIFLLIIGLKKVR